MMAEKSTEQSHPLGQFLAPTDYWHDSCHALQVGPPQFVVCPQCGLTYNHPGTPRRIEGNDNYEAGWYGRGPLLVIPFLCEEGHEWFLCLGFHKGNTTAFTVVDEVPHAWRQTDGWRR